MAREGVSGGMSGGVGSRVGGGVAIVVVLGGEWCLRQPRMGECRTKYAGRAERRSGRGKTRR